MAAVDSFIYENPVYGSSFPDPGALRNSSTDYYAYGTGGRFPILKSSDLVHWEEVGRAFSARPSWVVQTSDWHPWAPSVLRSPRSCPGTTSPGCYFMYYVGLSGEHTPATHCVGVAWSLTASGPFTDLGPIEAADGSTDLAGRPPGCGDGGGYSNIDPAPFVDDDGSVYLYLSTGRRCAQPTTGSCPYDPAISVLQMTDTPTQAASARKPLFGAAPGTWEHDPAHSPTVENPWMEKRGSTYYLFYSGGDYRASYGMGYATATSATGGAPFSAFAKSPHNPILRETAAVFSPGGGSVTVGPDGGSWFVYHGRATDYTQPRTLRIDPLFWSGSSIVTPGPTTGAQTAPSVDTSAPDTTIDSEFSFSSSEPASVFECKLDAASFEPCVSATGYMDVGEGPHKFEVRAIDSFGNADPTPASRSWTVEPAPAGTIEPSTSVPLVVPMADVTPPAFRLGARWTRRSRRTISVIVRATGEDLWSSVAGRIRIGGSSKAYRLNGVRARFVAGGDRRTLTPGISRQALRAVGSALRRHRRVTVTLTVEARDAAGNATVKKRTIELR